MPDGNPEILLELTDPRGKNIVLFTETWENHIIDGHPEMDGNLISVKETIEDPDWIREGRNPENEELYVKVRTKSKFQFTGTLASTRNIDGKTIIVTTAFEGDDSSFKGKMKWSKTKGNLI